jgi:TolA-binding protein
MLVLVAAVLAVLLAGMSIVYTSSAESLTQAVEAQQDRVEEANSAVRDQAVAFERERADMQQRLQALQTVNTELTDRINDLKQEVTALAADKRRLELDTANYDTQIAEFTALIETAQRLNEAQAEELGVLRRKEIDFARKEIELTDTINELTGEVDVLRDTNRALQEQLVDMRERVDAIAQGGGGTDGDRGARRAPQNFRGEVASVRQDPAGNTLVSINAGSNDRLSERMRLSVVRGDQFIATIVLQNVDLNDAVGRVDLSTGRTIREGDTVVPADTGL